MPLFPDIVFTLLEKLLCKQNNCHISGVIFKMRHGLLVHIQINATDAKCNAKTICSNIKLKKFTIHTRHKMIKSAEQYIQARAHTELMTKAGRWPALAEPTPLRRRHVLRLSHSVARNHQVMNPSVFGRTEARMSHDRERKGQGKEAASCRDRDGGQRTGSLGSDVH